MDYIVISNLLPDSESSRIRVRVSCKWDVYTLEGRFMSTYFIFVDEEGNYIHAIVWGNNARRLNDKLKEGLVYFVKKNSVVPNKDKYRVVVENDFMLELSCETTVRRVDQDNKEIPMHAAELNNLQPNVDEHYVDAIGVISTVGNVEEKPVRGSVAKLLNLEIADITGFRVRVTLWGTLAEDFKGILGSQAKDVNIGIFTSMGVKKFVNKYYLSSSRCTRLYINDDIAEIAELRLHLEQSDNLNDIVGDQEEFTLDFSNPQASKIAIAEILKLGRENRETDTTYFFNAKIVDVVTRNMWYYMSCGEHCKKGLKITKDGYWCRGCDKIVEYPLPRFRLELIVEDGTDKTMVTVFDEAAEFIVKAKAAELAAQEEDDDDGDDIILLEPIKNILGNEYSFYTKPSTFIKDEPYASFVSIKVSNKDNVDSPAPSKFSENDKNKDGLNTTEDKKMARKLDSPDKQAFNSSTPAQVTEKRKN